MESRQNEVTRLLCASAILIGSPFREIVIERLKTRFQAVAPEVGLDVKLLAQVCLHLESLTEERLKIARRFIPWFGGAWVPAAIVYAAAESAGAAIVLLLLAAWIIQYFKERQMEGLEEKSLLSYFSRDEFDPARVKQDFPAKIDLEIRSGLASADQNLVVYRGFSPFVGAGADLGGWSFAINLINPKVDDLGETLPTIPFQVDDLYTAIDAACRSLAFEGAVLKDMFFVHGRDIRDDGQILPSAISRPRQRLDVDQATHYIKISDDRIRHYKWFRIHYAHENVVVSFFLRCSIRGHNLFCEISRFQLTPLAAAYTEVDTQQAEEEKAGWRNAIREISRAFFAGILSAVSAWFLLLDLITSPLTGFLARRRERKADEKLEKEVSDNPAFNYGIDGSIRQLCSMPFYSHYFQRSDREMYVKIIDRTILDTIVEFVDAHNIDTSELKERRTTILNSGVIVQGGEVRADVMAVGTGAQATQQAGDATGVAGEGGASA